MSWTHSFPHWPQPCIAAGHQRNRERICLESVTEAADAAEAGSPVAGRTGTEGLAGQNGCMYHAGREWMHGPARCMHPHASCVPPATKKKAPAMPGLDMATAGPWPRGAGTLRPWPRERRCGQTSGGTCSTRPVSDDALLGACVERVRLGSDVQLHQRIFLAVIHLDGFAGLHRGTRDELETVGHVLEHDFTVLGVNAFFHRGSVGSAPKSGVLETHATVRQVNVHYNRLICRCNGSRPPVMPG